MTPPYIQLFKTPRCQYVLDVNKNALFPVSNDTFSFLRECMKGKADLDDSSNIEIQELRQNGYLSTESVVQKIFHPYTAYLPYFLERKIEKITLQVTQSCNLRCKYCIYSEDINMHQRSHSTKKMSWDVAKKSIEFLRDHSIDSERVNIGFYGGEPLLCFPLIKKAIIYAKEIFAGKILTFAITTNGTLLNSEIIEFFAQEDVHLTISLDGPKSIHDKNRVFADGRGSFDTVIRNLERIRQRFPEYARKTAFSMVMDPANDYDCINEVVTTFNDMNDCLFLASMVELDGNTPSIRSEAYSWKWSYQDFLALLSIFGRYPTSKVSALNRRLIGISAGNIREYQQISPLQAIDAPSGPCIPGQLRLFISAEGKFYPCERVSENSVATCIGSLDSGFNVRRAEEMLNIGRISSEKCKQCWCFRYCTACAKCADNGSAEFSPELKISHCLEIQARTYAKLRRFILLSETNQYYRNHVREGVIK